MFLHLFEHAHLRSHQVNGIAKLTAPESSELALAPAVGVFSDY